MHRNGCVLYYSGTCHGKTRSEYLHQRDPRVDESDGRSAAFDR
jgi:hypothetical protein